MPAVVDVVTLIRVILGNDDHPQPNPPVGCPLAGDVDCNEQLNIGTPTITLSSYEAK